jgi:hypothetical protein
MQLLEKLRHQGALAKEIETGWAASIPRGDQWDSESGRLQGKEYQVGPQAGFNPAALRSLNPADTDVAHALSAAGAAALPALLSTLEVQETEPWWVTCTIVSVLGSLGHVVNDAAADQQLRIAAGLMKALKHKHVWVRRNAADAVGTTIPLLQHIVGDDHIHVSSPLVAVFVTLSSLLIVASQASLPDSFFQIVRARVPLKSSRRWRPRTPLRLRSSVKQHDCPRRLRSLASQAHSRQMARPCSLGRRVSRLFGPFQCHCALSLKLMRAVQRAERSGPEHAGASAGQSQPSYAALCRRSLA